MARRMLTRRQRGAGGARMREEIHRPLQTAGFDGPQPIRPFFQAFLTAYDPATTGAGFDWGHLAVVVAWGLAGILVTMRYFRWSPRQG